MLSLPATHAPSEHAGQSGGDVQRMRDHRRDDQCLDDQLVDGPIVRRLVVALVCSGVLSTLALVLLIGSLLNLLR
jgi:hypothetical protein